MMTIERGVVSAARLRFCALVLCLAAAQLRGEESKHVPLPPAQLGQWAAKLHDGARPRTYSGKTLGYVAVPLGGIGTGSLAIDGKGKLIQWQIFNNFSKRTVVPDSFFAARVSPESEPSSTVVLQTEKLYDFPVARSLTLVGEYPFAWLTYHDPKLPVQITLEAFNPLIPLNPRDSATPCAIFTFRVTNPMAKSANVSLLASAQNAVGFTGYGAIAGAKYEGYVRNTNAVVGNNGATTVNMTAKTGEPSRMAKPMRLFTNAFGPSSARSVNLRVSTPGRRFRMPTAEALASNQDVIWLNATRDRHFGNAHIKRIATAVETGVTLLASGCRGSLAARLAAMPPVEKPAGPPPRDPKPTVLFEDFESGTFAKWTLTGEAFGDKPQTGTMPRQQRVSGFKGKGLVNTFTAGDGVQGTATSQPFTIERRYINFLIGGGSHAGRTCMNLLVDGKVVRTAAGSDKELLEAAAWDVGNHAGKQAVIQIVDKHTSGWGHINVDHIEFADKAAASPRQTASMALAAMMPFTSDGLASDGEAFDMPVDRSLPFMQSVRGDVVRVGAYLRFKSLQLKDGARVTLSAPDGSPLLIEGKHGKGRVLVYTADLRPGLVWTPQAALPLGLVAYAGDTSFEPATGIDAALPSYGSMTLSTLSPNATCAAQWTDPAKLWSDFSEDGRLTPSSTEPSDWGSTWNAALAAPVTVGPGETQSVTFVLTWHFPNHHYVRNMDARIGNMYSNWFSDALDVATYVQRHFQRLHAETRAYRDAIYDTTLPYYVVDAVTSQVDVIRSQTCMWTEADHFLGFEGNACCPMNCTHVWNYAQTLAKLWPSLSRNVREIDLGVQMHEGGMVGHRCGVPPTKAGSSEATDGQCGTVLKTYREYLQSANQAWLRKWYPRVKRATEFLIEKDKQAQPEAALDNWTPVENRALLEQVVKDTEPDGLIIASQWNTFDCSVHGPNPFVGSLYLAALRAAEEMAEIMGDSKFARQCRTVFERGQARFDQLLWHGKFGYYVQTYDEKKITSQQFGLGCHSDQMMGQWWADVLDLGYILPPAHVRGALGRVFAHNWRTNFRGHRQKPRKYALDDDKGLLICTWPHGRRPKKVTNYSDEIWTGIEYEVAAELIYQGFVKEGLMVVLGCRDRYDGRRRPGTTHNVGNPFDEVECGTNYARALSSWSVLLALQGYQYDGPRGVLGLKPRYKPEHIKSFFTTAEGWGTFEQTRAGRRQTDELDLRYGRLRLTQLVFEVPKGVRAQGRVLIDGQTVASALTQDASAVTFTLARPARVVKGQTIRAELTW